MSENTSKSERIIKETAKQSMRDAISMIICDEAEMVCRSKLVLDCGKSIDVADRILELQANESGEAEASEVRFNARVSDNRRWKDVDEALPESNGKICKHFWIYTKDGSQQKAAFQFKTNSWFDLNSLDDIENVTHWMELPKPPE